MARPKNDPNAPKAPKNHVEAVEQGLIDVSHVPEDRPDHPMFEEIRNDYENEIKPELEKARERKAAAREMSRTLEILNKGSRDQIAWALWELPSKTRKGTDEEDEATEAANTTEATEATEPETVEAE